MRGLALACAAALILALPGSSLPGGSARAGDSLEARKLPMQFTWHEAWHEAWHESRHESPLEASPDHASSPPCSSGCRGFVAAVGAITGDTVREFADFSEGRDLRGATIVLDSSGGSVLDAIALGRTWRDLGVATTVGITTETREDGVVKAGIFPGAYCESMCVFLLLSGKTRSVPDGAHVRVHQIWMGDRAEDATAASYTAQDVMIIERDVGRLAKYTFEMGGSGELLGLALSVPPWEPLHELTPSELRLTNLVTDDTLAQAQATPTPAAANAGGKPVQDRVLAGAASPDEMPSSAQASMKATKTAEAAPPTGAALPAQR